MTQAVPVDGLLKMPFIISLNVRYMQSLGNIAHFTTFSIQNLLFGSDEISEDLNTRLFKHVHHFIQNTHRFD